jgi:hypothetical protein
MEENPIKEFQKKLSEDEINALSYLDWSDERLGQLYRANMESLNHLAKKYHEGTISLCAGHVLAIAATESGTDRLSFDLICSDKEDNADKGDWRISVERLFHNRSKVDTNAQLYRELRTGNLVHRNESGGGYREIVVGPSDIILANSMPELYRPIPIAPERLKLIGFEKTPVGYHLSISQNEKDYRVISVSENDIEEGVKTFYLYLRQGDASAPRHNDDVVLVRNDLKYLHTLMNFIADCTGQEPKLSLNDD